MQPRELTLRGLVLGALITTVFTAANVYLGLKVGLTFASSIPAAVISMAVLSLVRDSSILENNIVQLKDVDEIIGAGFDEAVVHKVVRLIDGNEYKRRQAAPGLKVTTKAFGVGRRIPVAQGSRRGPRQGSPFKQFPADNPARR